MRAYLASATLALSIAACATQPAIVPGMVLEVNARSLSPFKMHEECAKLLPGDRLEYSFDADAPLHFNIHYHEGKAVVMPLTRDQVRADSGEFKVLAEQDYCLTWEAGASPAKLHYRVRLIRPTR